MNNTKIAWTQKTWNVVTGCSKYSAGCANCYAEALTKRFPKAFPNGFNVTLHPERLDEPKHVKKPSMFFVCSMADLFHDDVPFEFIDRVMDIIEICPQHTFQILTKRPERMYQYFCERTRPCHRRYDLPKNIWIGTTVENAEATKRLFTFTAILLPHTTNVRFLSCEPLLGDLGELDLRDIDWVIAGGESGPKARPMKKEWVLNIKRQCAEQNVAFFFKSWGRYGESGKPCPKDQHDLIDGIKYQAYPKGWEKGETK